MRSQVFETAAAVAFIVLTASTIRASDVPLECTTDGAHNWKVKLVGPLTVTCPGGGDCTEVDYVITPLKGQQPDHVAVLTEHDMNVVVPEARHVYAPCVGDSVTLMGIHDCSSSAVRINKNVEKGAFELVVTGLKALRGKSIVVKKGKIQERCSIASLGQDDFDVNALRPTSQELFFKGCTVTIPTDPITGEGGAATISGPGCKFVANGDPVGNAQLVVNGINVGDGLTGDGFLSNGQGSCTTKIISRRLYTWCTCADVTGDGVPDDPKPPCPTTVP